MLYEKDKEISKAGGTMTLQCTACGEQIEHWAPPMREEDLYPKKTITDEMFELARHMKNPDSNYLPPASDEQISRVLNMIYGKK
jgi:hypothetical protein